MENDPPQTAPSRFLQRIAGYPEAVQKALSAELTDASLIAYLQVLHGSAPEASALPSAGGGTLVADAMLSRLISSKRFVARQQQFLHILRQDDPAQQSLFDNLFNGMILPLADPDAPYLYKIEEARTADPQGALAEVIPALKDILGLCQRLDLHRRGATARTNRQINGDWLAKLILQTARDADTSLLTAVFAALGHPMRLESARPTADTPPISQEGRLFLQRMLRNTAQFSKLDTESMASIARSGLGKLASPRSLTVILTGAQDGAQDGAQGGAQGGEDEADWNRLRDLGLITAVLPEGSSAETVGSGGQLHLPAGVKVSAVTLGWLSCVELPEGNLALAAERGRTQDSWAQHITGYLGDEVTLDSVALYQATADAPKRSRRQLLLDRVSRQMADGGGARLPGSGLDSPDACYAIILRLQAGLPLGGFVNIENCLAYDSLADLTQAFAGASARLRKKPVVVIGPGSSATSDYILTSATRFRALGGDYLTTPLVLQYDGAAGKLLLSQPEQDQLTAFALAEASVLPLGMLLDSPQDIENQLKMGVFVIKDGFALCHARAGTGVQEDPALQRLQRRLASRQLTAAEKEQLFLISPPDFSRLQVRDAIAHWPVEDHINTIQQKYQHLQSRLKRFQTTPRSQIASEFLQNLAPESKEALSLAPQIDAFVVKLSETPAELVSLPAEDLLAFLGLCRHTANADRVAASLSTYALQICNKDHGLIVPLFEFLACCLPPSDLRTTLAFAADVRPKNRRYMLRIAECLRRYGDAPLMEQYLALVRQQDPETLKDITFIRCFQAVLASPRMTALVAILGADTLRAIAGTVSFADGFKQAVLAQDKAEMHRLVADPIPDFLKWADGLRALSNELRALASETEAFAIPGISGLYRRKLAAITFADRVTLRGFAEQGFLDSTTDLDVIGQHLLGNPAPLASFIARAFEGTGAPAFEIAGDSTAAVFDHAQASVSNAAPPGSATRPDAPLVSVIMSAFNPDIDLMRLSVGSLLAQTHAAIEIFVVDDASTADSSAAIQAMLAEFPQADRQKIDYSRLAVNCGPYVGRNLALARARGQFIAIQDADDWSHPQRFAAQLAAFAATPELRLVTSPHVRIDRFGAVQMEAGFTVFGDGPMTSMFRRDLFDEIGGFANIRSRGDVEMRERIRSYYGGHVLLELQMPCMLCFADSATLSQKTKSESAEYLQIFRTNISRKRSFADLRRAGQKLRPEHSLVVPVPLRPQWESLA